MRHIIITFILLSLIVAGCSSSREKEIRELEGVKLYDAMNSGLEYAEQRFSDDEARAIADLVQAECPQGVGDEFYRVTLDAKSSTLVLYTDKTGKNVTCSLLKSKDQKQITIKTQKDAPNNTTAVSVNGKPITLAQVQQYVAALPRGSQIDESSLNLVVNRAINDELLRQEAAQIDVTAEDIAAAKTSVLASADVKEENLPSLLEERGLSQKEFDDSVKAQAQLTALFKERLLFDSINVSEELARDYYLSNPNAFLQSEQALML